jgi:threonine dehydrogenase-like Zn-dependent dehydrogenase
MARQIRELGPMTHMTTKTKPKLALYWAASCGGCEIAVLEIEEKILDVDAAFDIVFWPVAVDFKVKDVEAMEDGAIDVCLFNGAIRTAENEHMAALLRRKSKVLVAFGACACEGAIPALAKGGWLMLYGSIHPKGDLPVDPNDIHYRELNITGTYSHDKESFREAVALLNERLVDVSAFISERVPFPSVDYAMQRALAKDTYRVVVEFV